MNMNHFALVCFKLVHQFRLGVEKKGWGLFFTLILKKGVASLVANDL
jgi:hypothetical protein